MTIEEHYHVDRKACKNKPERKTVWRTYALALHSEIADRIDRREGHFATIDCALLGGWPHRWRIDPKTGARRLANFKAAAGDDHLAIRYIGYWRKLTDDDLLALWDALIRARER